MVKDKKKPDGALGKDPFEDIEELIQEEISDTPDSETSSSEMDNAEPDDVKSATEQSEVIETKAGPSLQMEEEDHSFSEEEMSTDETQVEIDTGEADLPSEIIVESDAESEQLLEQLIATIDHEVEQIPTPEVVSELRTPIASEVQGEEQFIIFSLVDTEYAVPITNVTEIGRPPDITSVPNVPEWLLGVTNLRGDIISVVDLRSFLGMGIRNYNQSNRMLVAHASREELTIGLIVDRVSEIRYLALNQIHMPTAPIEDQVTPYLRGVYEHEARLLVLLDLEKLLLSSEMRQFEPV